MKASLKRARSLVRGKWFIRNKKMISSKIFTMVSGKTTKKTVMEL